ncbi:MAG: LemA family protein [Methanomassiliicoccaceae archaeon]|nr:LemA family protein [Methanomassiliicoccaceae archaeon]
MDVLYIVIAVIVVIAALFAFWAVLAYNGFVSKKLKVENNFSQIKIQCKKRFDLVPNLVETVKGYAKHEKETLENVIAARGLGVSAKGVQDLAEADNMLTRTLGRLFALGEAYPELRANANFMHMQNELVEIEKTIAASRSFYNDSVMMYNKAIMIFPNSIMASLFGFKKAEFFDAPEEETQNVKVSF